MQSRVKAVGLAFLFLLLVTEGSVGEPPYVHSVAIQRSDSHREIIEKAASVVPSLRQQMHYRDAFIGFIHFGPNTFTGVEWGDGLENPDIFDPGDTLDTDQWCRSMRAAGITKVIITAKHHDGFCLWQTRYNKAFSVRASPWRRGKGDVLRELADSCRKHHMKLGVYLSPADLFQMENKEGVYGNASSDRQTVIPTDAASMLSDPSTVRKDLPQGSRTFEFQVDDYNRYFMNQLYELLTEYGPVHEVWFDGAHPKRKGGQQYRKDLWFQMIRELAPEAVIFGGPDVRWCGNEGGYTRNEEWSVLPVQDMLHSGVDRPGPSPGGRDAITSPSYEVYGTKYRSHRLQFLVCEVNTSIRSGWFWRNEHEQAVRSADDVFDIYERSLGGNATFLLNVPPDRHGRFPDRDVACLMEVGRRIRETYGENLLAGSEVSLADDCGVLLDDDLSTYLQLADSTSSFEIQLPGKQSINRVVLQEAICHVGQRVEKVIIDGFVDGDWRNVASAKTVGFKHIFRFPAVETNKLRFRILDARLAPAIAEVAAYYHKQSLPGVVVTPSRSGQVSLSAKSPYEGFDWNRYQAKDSLPSQPLRLQIRYAIGEDQLSAKSPTYQKPLPLPYGGRVKAQAFDVDSVGPVTDVRLGVSQAAWRIHGAPNSSRERHEARFAIDASPETYWLARAEERATPPSVGLTIDMGQIVHVQGATLRQPKDGLADSCVSVDGVVEASTDLVSWRRLGEFRLGNLQNDRRERSILFPQPVNARYVRFKLALDQSGAGLAISNLGVLGSQP